MFLKALFFSLLALPFANAQTCNDDPNYNWQYTFNGQRYTLTCAFLTNPTNPAQQQKRINNWCPQTVDGINIKDKCRKSCGNCSNNDNDDKKPCVQRNPKWTDRWGNKCSFYASNPTKFCGSFANANAMSGFPSANANCCVCGGGKSPDEEEEFGTIDTEIYMSEDDDEECVDEKKFKDPIGKKCDWYDKKKCKQIGKYTGAKKACCVCGGGDKKSFEDYETSV